MAQEPEVVQSDMSLDEVMDMVKSEGRNAGLEAVTEKMTEMMERTAKAFDKLSETEKREYVEGNIEDFKKQVKAGIGANGAFSWTPNRTKDNTQFKTAAELFPLLASAGFNKEKAIATATKLGKDHLVKSLEMGDYDAAGVLVDHQTADDFVEALYSRNVMLEMGARTIDLSNGPVNLGKQNASATFYWVGEGESITVSNPTFEELVLYPKSGGVLVPITNKLLRALPQGYAQLVEDDMVAVAENGMDTAYFDGTGTEHQPKGIYHSLDTANQISLTAESGISLSTINDELLKLIYQPLDADIPGISYGWGFHPRIMIFLMSQLTTEGVPVYQSQLMSGQLLTYPIGVTTNIVRNRGGGSDETRVFFGDFSQVVVGQSNSVRVSMADQASFVDSESNTIHGFQQGYSLLKAEIETDVVLRHSGAFAVGQGDWGASLDV